MVYLSRYFVITYFRSFRFIPPVAVFCLWVVIFYTYSQKDIMNSYLISSIVLYLISAWLTHSMFHREDHSERAIILTHIKSKMKFLLSKNIAVLVYGSLLIIFAIVYPLILNGFLTTPSISVIIVSIISHVLLCQLGVIVGKFFAVTKHSQYHWLATCLVLMVSLVTEAVANGIPTFLAWILWLLPPINNIVHIHNFGDSFIINTTIIQNYIIVISYIIIASSIIVYRFKKFEY
ncbi:hypothetical protein [Cytobacillus sp. IB215316]|uniref:hypothetical protein n=1 Tax=Cytobacillus sp. IB215316 TaxID=3097354 RepID=UPI002A1018F7|nr:hypothetical protein [Cytobacillus sp. IB215316]MDX8361909.1 hypothetical protein [Cytobacillus sp. IB215316]